MLFAIGAAAGFVVAVGATAALEQLPLPANMPISLELSPDLRVLAFALGISLRPAWRSGWRRRSARRARTSPPGCAPIRPAADGVDRGWARAMIVAQIALPLVLLVAAGLFARALGQGQQVDPGFDMTNVVTATFDSESWGYDEARARDLLPDAARARRRTRHRRRRLVYGTAAADGRQLDRQRRRSTARSCRSTTRRSTPAISATIGIPVVAGRRVRAPLTTRGAPSVAIVNETLARKIAARRQRHRPHVPLPRHHHHHHRRRGARREIRDARSRRHRPSPTSRSRRSGARRPSLLVKTTGGTRAVCRRSPPDGRVDRSQPAAAARRHAGAGHVDRAAAAARRRDGHGARSAGSACSSPPPASTASSRSRPAAAPARSASASRSGAARATSCG